MRDISIAFGGIKAVDHATIDLYPGEVVGPARPQRRRASRR
jgi:D-xylose transport system ATP-binding protein